MEDSGRAREDLLRELAMLRNKIKEMEKREEELKGMLERSLKEAEMHRQLVEFADDSIYMVDRDYRYLYMNKKHQVRLGISGDDFINHSYMDFHSSEEAKEFINSARIVFEKGWSTSHEYLSKRDGRYFLQTFSPVRFPDGEVMAVAVISKDITGLKRLQQELHELTLTDDLTGLRNRRGFITLAGQLLKQANRLGYCLFMLYADVDNLKHVNDNFGHKEGDVLLMEVATLLRDNYRSSDIIARIGGDEFVVIPVGSSEDKIELITSRLERALEARNREFNRGYRLELSWGIAKYDPADPCTVEELLERADRLMYEHKMKKKGK